MEELLGLEIGALKFVVPTPISMIQSTLQETETKFISIATMEIMMMTMAVTPYAE